MLLRRMGLTAIATVMLAACGADPLRYATPPAATQTRQPIAYSRVGVREVSLPTYAALEEITVVQADGALSSTPDSLWADDPSREVTLSITRTLSQATGATVAAEPWPFRDVPDATVDVRIERMLAEADGRFRLTGQYYVAPEGFDLPERSRLFDLSVPFVAEGGYNAIAAARAEAITNLALLIAREGLN
ncbi:MAG: PqiC family protein [Celeribacter sp.]